MKLWSENVSKRRKGKTVEIRVLYIELSDGFVIRVQERKPGKLQLNSERPMLVIPEVSNAISICDRTVT